MQRTKNSARVVALATWAVFAVFFLNGLNFSTWASRLPAVRDALSFNEAQMGTLLLFSAFGSIAALPLAGFVVQKIGAARTVATFAAINVLGLIGASIGVVGGNAMAVRIALVAAGVGTGVWDASMNLEGAAVEQGLGKAIMPRFHAAFSFGTMAGAGLGAVAALWDIPLEWHLGTVVVLGLIAVLWSVRYFLPAGDVAQSQSQSPGPAESSAAESSAPGHVPAASGAHPAPGTDPSENRRGGALSAWLEPRTLLIGVVVLAAALTEGAANDWVSLAVVDGFGESDAMGAVGLAVFLTAMTGMRLLGTGLLDRFGRVVVLRCCAVFAIAGLLVFTLVPNLVVALFGVALWGIGAALGFPVGMSAASDDPKRAALRVSVVATIGYSAFFIGPPLIGLLAEHLGYRHALMVILVPVVLSLIVVTVVRPLPGAVGAKVPEPVSAGGQGTGDNSI